MNLKTIIAIGGVSITIATAIGIGIYVAKKQKRKNVCSKTEKDENTVIEKTEDSITEAETQKEIVKQSVAEDITNNHEIANQIIKESLEKANSRKSLEEIKKIMDDLNE